MPASDLLRESGPIDMQRLADLAKVSRSTVSRALNDSPLVNAKTKQKIRELADTHNYVLNQAARNFRLQKTHIVSVVLMLDTAADQHVSDPFFLEMIGSVADALAAAGFDTLLCHEPIASAAEFAASRIYRQSEGIIFIGQGHMHDQFNRLEKSGPPIVVWGANLSGREYRLVGSDNIQGGYLASVHLLSQNCRKIGFLGDKSLPEPGLRYQGYQQALLDHGVEIDPALELVVPFEAAHADQVIDKFLDQRPRMDGIMCCSDLIAMSAIASLNRHKYRVPEDIAVVGYDDIGIASRANPSLTTISQNIRLGGELLVRKLIGLINGKRVRDSIAPAELVVRQSSLRQG